MTRRPPCVVLDIEEAGHGAVVGSRITICVEEEAAAIRSAVAHLLLESEDVGDATVDGVLQPGSSLVGDGERRLRPVGDRKLQEELGRVARPEHLVDRGEVRSSLFIAEAKPSGQTACKQRKHINSTH
ncbi:hypothetical protein BHM03_00022727 [Ensete ventricosum]|nr:hypothetical protein BHM03_00022727 [Ensete ventricosum]